MSEISVRQRVGSRLQPHDYGVNFAQCANEGMVYEEVDDEGCYNQTHGRIDAVAPCNQLPYRLELLLVDFGGRFSPAPLMKAEGGFRLARGREFDSVGNEEVTGYYEVEERSEDDVLSLVVVTTEAYQYAILSS